MDPGATEMVVPPGRLSVSGAGTTGATTTGASATGGTTGAGGTAFSLPQLRMPKIRARTTAAAISQGRIFINPPPPVAAAAPAAAVAPRAACAAPPTPNSDPSPGGNAPRMLERCSESRACTPDAVRLGPSALPMAPMTKGAARAMMLEAEAPFRPAKLAKLLVAAALLAPSRPSANPLPWLNSPARAVSSDNSAGSRSRISPPPVTWPIMSSRPLAPVVVELC